MVRGVEVVKGIEVVGDFSCLTASEVKDYDVILRISKNCLRISRSFKVLRRFRGLKGFRVSQKHLICNC